MSSQASEILECAHLYREQGIHVMPLAPGKKTPISKFANYLRRPQQNLAELFGHGENIAAFMGAVSGNLHALDIDVPAIFENRFKKKLSIAQKDRLTELENSTWVFNSASARIVPGKRQIIIRTEVPLRSRMTDKHPDFGFGVRGETTGLPNYSAFPNSAIVDEHGQQGLYLWQNSPERTPIVTLSRSDIENEFRFMPFEIAEKGFNKYGLNDSTWQLVRGAREYLADSGKLRVYESRSEAEQAIVYRLAALGWTFDAIYDFFKQEVYHGAKFHEKRDGKAWLEIGFRNALQKLESRPGISRDIERLFYESQFFEFNPRTWFTDSAIYRSALEIANNAGTLTPALPVRRVAEMAGVTKTTAGVSIQRMRKQGFFNLFRDTRTAQSNIYEIQVFENLPESVSKPDSSSHSLALQCQLSGNDTEAMTHDAFRNRGLGKNGAFVYEFLRQHEIATAEQIVKGSGMARMTVFRKLSKMKQSGLADSKDGFWVLKPDHNLNRVAAQLGVKDAGERQKREHEAQREAFAESHDNARDALKILCGAMDFDELCKALSVNGKQIHPQTLERWINNEGRIPARVRSLSVRLARECGHV